MARHLLRPADESSAPTLNWLATNELAWWSSPPRSVGVGQARTFVSQLAKAKARCVPRVLAGGCPPGLAPPLSPTKTKHLCLLVPIRANGGEERYHWQHTCRSHSRVEGADHCEIWGLHPQQNSPLNPLRRFHPAIHLRCQPDCAPEGGGNYICHKSAGAEFGLTCSRAMIVSNFS